MKPIICLHHLDFTKRDFAVCVGDTLAEASKCAERRLSISLEVSEDEHATAMCITKRNGATVLLFKPEGLTAAIICHEVTHATNAMFEHIGIQLCAGSDEAFAYHNDMLFRLVAELLLKHKVNVPLV